MKIGVYFLAESSGGNGRGDVLLLTPALRELRAKYPQAFIGCVVRHSELLARNPNVDKYYEARPISRSPFDELYRDADLNLYVDYQAYHPYKKHFIDLLCELCDVHPSSKQLELYLSPEEEEVGRQVVHSARRANNNNFVVALHVSASSPNREWSVQKWNQLVLRCPDLTFVQLGGEHEPPIEGTIRVANAVTVRQAAAVVKYADTLVCIDSYMQHAAAAVGTRGVVLCGASDPRVCGHELHTYLIHREVACVPCHRPLLPLYDLMPDPQDNDKLVPWICAHRSCMRALAVEEVQQALYSFLGHIKAG